MVFGVHGPIGTGKGCFMTHKAMQLAAEGRDVYANYPIYDTRIKLITRWSEVADLGDCEVFIDEAHLWFPARQSNTHGKIEEMSVWAQSRHDGNNLWWASQKPGQVDLQIRDTFTHYHFRLHRVFGPDMKGRRTAVEKSLGVWIIVRQFDAADFHAVTKRRLTKWFPLRIDRLWGLYDTHWIVGTRDGVGARPGRGSLEQPQAAPVDPEQLARKRAFAMNYVPDEIFNRTYYKPGAGATVEDSVAAWLRRGERSHDDKNSNECSSVGLGDCLRGVSRGTGSTPDASGGTPMEERHKPRFKFPLSERP